MNKLARISASAAATGIMLSAGLVGATGSIDTTGPDSENEINHSSSVDFDVNNDTDVDANLDIDQDANSGDADVKHNTEGGDASTGDASNDNSIEAMIDVDNRNSSSFDGLDGCLCTDGDSSIDRTGPDSHNSVNTSHDVDVDIDNKVDVDFDVDIDQDADSGDATVWGNTEGGSASSGSASNSSSTVFSLTVQN